MATKAVRNNVAACRLTDDQWKSISDKLAATKIQGAPSPGLLARKLLLDWDDGELKFKTKARENTTRERWMADQVVNAKAPKGIRKNGQVSRASAPVPTAG